MTIKVSKRRFARWPISHVSFALRSSPKKQLALQSDLLQIVEL